MVHLVRVRFFLVESVHDSRSLMLLMQLMLLVVLIHERLVHHHILISLSEVPVLLVHIDCVGIGLVARHRALRRLFARYLDRLTILHSLVGQVLFVKESQTLEVLISFEDFVPVDFLEVNLLHTVVAVWMVPNYWLKPAGVDTADLADHANELVLVLVLGNDHV